MTTWLVHNSSFEKPPHHPAKGSVLGYGRVSREGQDLGTAACRPARRVQF